MIDGRYHFLLQSEPDVMSLDDYVLNTGLSPPFTCWKRKDHTDKPVEAHPLMTNPNLRPGYSNLWDPPASNQHIGVRGQGTDAQKWARLEVLRTARGGARLPGSEQIGGAGGGQGMGGGGGDPGFRPKPPGF